ncbi:hypothetical protein TNCV_2379431 [Trichonephila clavipes]|uniref:Uncharacterized protein n=1 Tax=Trichonephila clavipes TaxID=2585209 RepID=A0A8X6RIN6_TRICX|nr:hypothetical protein TNCV_2379431 [Trichonephila clavipes]
MLLLLVQSCIPEDILPIWLRNPSVSTAEESYSQKLTQLLKFLRLEVEGLQRIFIAKSGFKSYISGNKSEQSHQNGDINTSPTRAALVCTDVKKLWSLETIGIRDPVENLNERELNSKFHKKPEELLIAAVGMEKVLESSIKSEVPVAYTDQEVNPKLTEVTLWSIVSF